MKTHRATKGTPQSNRTCASQLQRMITDAGQISEEQEQPMLSLNYVCGVIIPFIAKLHSGTLLAHYIFADSPLCEIG